MTARKNPKSKATLAGAKPLPAGADSDIQELHQAIGLAQAELSAPSDAHEKGQAYIDAFLHDSGETLFPAWKGEALEWIEWYQAVVRRAMDIMFDKRFPRDSYQTTLRELCEEALRQPADVEQILTTDPQMLTLILCDWLGFGFPGRRRMEKLQVGALIEEERRGTIAHTAPMIDKVVSANFELIGNITGEWRLEEKDRTEVREKREELKHRLLWAVDALYPHALAGDLAPRITHRSHATSAAAPVQPGARDALTEARDEWMYNLAMEGTPYGVIARRLSQRPEAWSKIDTDRGVRKAIFAYADRHGLAEPSPRRPGRRIQT